VAIAYPPTKMTIAKAAKHAHRKRESICIKSLIRPWPHTSSQSLAAKYRGAIGL